MRKYVPWHKLNPQSQGSALLRSLALIFFLPVPISLYVDLSSDSWRLAFMFIGLPSGLVSLVLWLFARRIERRLRERTERR